MNSNLIRFIGIPLALTISVGLSPPTAAADRNDISENNRIVLNGTVISLEPGQEISVTSRDRFGNTQTITIGASAKIQNTSEARCDEHSPATGMNCSRADLSGFDWESYELTDGNEAPVPSDGTEYIRLEF